MGTDSPKSGERAGTTGPTRVEHDSLGDVAVPAARLWGAQTQRGLEHFAIGGGAHPMPRAVIRALVEVKRASAIVNRGLGRLDVPLADAIVAAADEVLAGAHDGEFPLPIWQSGSGTPSNMNVNEVLANRASELLGGRRGERRPVHPNDHVNLGQSSNDVFPTAMYLAAVPALDDAAAALDGLAATLRERAARFAGVVKLGRTHLQDATPTTFGHELGGWAAQAAAAADAARATRPGLLELAVGATAVGTGQGAHPAQGDLVVAELARRTGLPFVPARSRPAAIASHDALVFAHSALRVAAVALMKIASDVRLLASGPRGAIGELALPANEPGSSMMPGKVNPTQAEMVTMVAARVLGNDVTVGVAGSQGQLELNVFKPVLIHTFLESADLVAGASRSFVTYALAALAPEPTRAARHVASSLMLATALVPHIGYDRAAEVAQLAAREDLTVAEAAARLGVGSPAELGAWLDPARMVGPSGKGSP